MFTNQSENTYKITLPSSTSREVREWFAVMENNNKLTEALIELIHGSIKSGKPVELLNMQPPSHYQAPEGQNTQEISQDSFFENMYNWQESNSAIFKEEKKEKKEKKKMLSV